ncbi:MAG: protein kinase, partial [Acidobacteriota bacterium]
MKVPETVGPYRIEGILGRGGMGEVFRGVHLRLRRTVALKRIHPEKADNPKARARFLREARITARLQSPFLVSVHDVLESPDALWLVMELVEGQSLDRWLETGPPDVGLGLRLAADITAGLTVIHEAGILHRDLASKNVMVTTPRPERDEPIPRARLLDFGLAKDQDETGAPLTSTGNLIGTPRAMSPEQANGKAMDVRSDLFSLGALFYELFVGVSPFAAQTALETLGRICHHEPDPMRRHRPELPETLDRWVGRLLAKDPTERPRSAREVSAALDSLLYLEAASGLESDSGSFPASTPQGRRPRLSHVGSWNEGRSERRQLTVVCGELVGTEREGGDASGSLEPEALLQVLGPFHGWLRRVLEQYGGYLGELRDHRVELYFGWPQAQEHDIQKAVAAALELADSGGRLQDPRPEKPGLAVRVGVHLGPVMRVATADERERLVLGEIAERAAALRDAAGPGEVWGSATVSRQVAGQYRVERQAPVSATGASGLEPQGWPEGEGAARIQRLPGEESPGEPSLPEPSVTVQAKTPMVGRQWELDLLRGRLRQAAEGVGQAVSIIGEPGIGKTRLLEAFREQPGGPASFQVCRGSAFRGCDTLAPLADLVRRLLGVDEARDLGRQGQDREGQDEAWAMQLSQALESYDLPTEDLMPTLGLWLGLEKNDT